VRRGSLPHSSRCGGHQAERDGAEQRSPRTAGRQLDTDARDVLDHARTDLDQALADRREPPYKVGAENRLLPIG
jgi:hypothetical protein